MKLSNTAISLLTGAVLLASGPATLLAFDGAPSASPYVGQSWDTPPSEAKEVARQGFHDGIEGARKDFENHRRPDVNNRDEYRHPKVRHEDRDDYRDGFRRGYQVGVDHLMAEHR